MHGWNVCVTKEIRADLKGRLARRASASAGTLPGSAGSEIPQKIVQSARKNMGAEVALGRTFDRPFPLRSASAGCAIASATCREMPAGRCCLRPNRPSTSCTSRATSEFGLTAATIGRPHAMKFISLDGKIELGPLELLGDQAEGRPTQLDLQRSSETTPSISTCLPWMAPLTSSAATPFPAMMSFPPSRATSAERSKAAARGARP
jgi:hypothetical protein